MSAAATASLSKRLMQANIERDNALAAMADEKLQSEATHIGSDYLKERWQKRQARRALEALEGLQHAIPPGPWDDDLDNYLPGMEYIEDIDDGYSAVLRRSWMTWMWIICIRIPSDHPLVGKPYQSLPRIQLTYSKDNEFGYVLPTTFTGTPAFFHSTSARVEHYTSMYFMESYVDYRKAIELARKLKADFVMAQKNPSEFCYEC